MFGSHNPIDLICPLLLIIGGILGASALIISKRPDAAQYIAKIQPFQGLIGFGLLGVGVWTLVRSIPYLPHMFDQAPFNAVIVLAVVLTSVGLGCMFGMQVLARISPRSAHAGEELAAKLAPYHVLIGLLGILAGILFLLSWAGIDFGSSNAAGSF